MKEWIEKLKERIGLNRAVQSPSAMFSSNTEQDDTFLKLIAEIEQLEKENRGQEKLIDDDGALGMYVAKSDYDKLMLDKIELRAIVEKAEAVDWIIVKAMVCSATGVGGYLIEKDEYEKLIDELTALQQALAAHKKEVKD